MFLSFLCPIPNRDDTSVMEDGVALLVLYYGGFFAQTQIMEFPEVMPEFENLQDVMVGYATPEGRQAWSFTGVGNGELAAEDKPDAPAVDFFISMIKGVNSPDEDQIKAAQQVMQTYADQAITFYFDDDTPVSASFLSIEKARNEIEIRRSAMH